MAEQLCLDFEEWRKVKDWPYEASSLGRLRRMDRGRNGHGGKILKEGRKLSRNYLNVVLTDSQGRRQSFGLHVIICTAFHGPKPSEDHEVAHRDGNPFNNRSDNVRWATHKENCHDRVLKFGKNRVAHLSEEQVLYIRSLPAGAVTAKELACQFGVATHVIYDIRRNRSWQWLLNK